MFRPLIVLAIYFLIQFVCTIPFIANSIIQGYEFSNIMPSAYDLSWSLIASSAITVVILHAFRFINLAKPGFRNLKPKSAALAIVSIILLMFASNILTEWMQLDNIMADQFSAMAQTTPGAFAIGIVGPIAEEYVFREAIQGGMLRYGARPWVAYFVSALIFGIVHANPAQIPFAFLVGLAFAVVYMHTRSIIPVIICHIINNSTSVVLMNIYSDSPDIQFSDIMGNAATIITFAFALIGGFALLKYSIELTKTDKEAI